MLSFSSVAGESLQVANKYWNLVAKADGSERKACPGCGFVGDEVEKATVRSITRRELRDKLGDMKGFRFSDTLGCPIVYYNNEEGHYVTLAEVNRRVGQKETVPDRMICYCLQVPENKILSEIVERGCCTTLQDVREYTKANTGTACLVTNPRGVCCDVDILGIIQKGLRLGGREAIADPEVGREACCALPAATETA